MPESPSCSASSVLKGTLFVHGSRAARRHCRWRTRLQIRQTEQNPHEKPEICVAHIVLIGRQTQVRKRIQEDESEPPECERNREKPRSFQPSNDFPRRIHQSGRPENPKKGCDNSHLDHQYAIAFFDPKTGGGLPEKPRDILRAEGSGARAVSQNP